MKLTHLPTAFQAALPVMEKIVEAGYEAYFVGGSVRDIILEHAIHDVDIATSAFPAELKELFPKTIDVGIEHGTVMVLNGLETYEVTTFRTESTYQDYRRPDHVEFVRSLEEDLKRRDFTMNALALSLDGQIIDLFHGLEAIEAKEIRAVGDASDRFHEDALRMMRGLRFSSQLDFELAPPTIAAMKQHAALLAKISVERIHVEFLKMMTARTWKKGFGLFLETGCFAYCPGFSEQQASLAKILDLPTCVLESEEQVWTMIAHALQLAHRGELQSFLKAWKCSNDVIAHVKRATEALAARINGLSWTDDKWALYQTTPEILVTVEESFALWQATPPETELARATYDQLPIHQLSDLAVDGQALMDDRQQKPGPWLGITLKQLEKAVVLGLVPNEKTALLAYSIVE